MSAFNQRLTRLMPALSAQERGILILQSLKYGTPEAPALRRVTQQADARELNHYIARMNTANLQFAAHISVVESMIETVEACFTGLLTLQLCQEERELIKALVWHTLKRPITESEYLEKAEAAAQEFVPVADLAWVLANEHAFEERDSEVIEGFPVPVVKDAALQRLCAHKEKELRHMAASGALVSRGKGADLQLQNASFYAWLGRPVPAWPEWPGSYEVLPDERQAEARFSGALVDRLAHVLQRSPLEGHLEVPSGQGLPWLIDQTKESLARNIESLWQEVLGTDHVLEQIALAFGEDPLKPATREAHERTRQRLLELQDQMAKLAGKDITLPELDNQTIAAMDAFAQKAMRVYA